MMAFATRREHRLLIRSIYTLRYLGDPQLQRNVHRSQNRIESYHQLRAVIAQVAGKKELSGRTDIDIEWSMLSFSSRIACRSMVPVGRRRHFS
jgi:TnpA family transposase